MIILRKTFSKLKDSRIGIGWIQEGNSKTRSEKYFKLGKEAANKSYDENEDEEEAVKKAKSKVTKEILKDELPVPVGKSIGYGGLAYIAAKSPEMINKLTSKHPEIIGDVKIPEKMSKFTKKHSGKIAAAVVGGSLLHQLSKKNLKKKLDSARTGIEVNTRDRVKKTNTSKKS